MKKYIYPLAITAALFATACSDDEVNAVDNPDAQKEMISFSMEDAVSTTRAGFTGGDTKIFMRIKSQSKETGKTNRYTRTSALAERDNTGTAITYSTVSFTLDEKRYWDDAYGRNAKLSIYALAIPNQKNSTKLTASALTAGTTIWFEETEENEKAVWTVSLDQSGATTLADEDLCYSNNISENGHDGRYVYNFSTGLYPAYNNGTSVNDLEDGCMVFSQEATADPSAPGKFDKGHLIFKHALSRLVVKLKEGTGFDGTIGGTSTDFSFKTGTNVKLINMPYTGTFDISSMTPASSWSSMASVDITKMQLLASGASDYDASVNYSLIAQVLPGYSFGSTSATNVMEFTIDDNTYYVTQKMVFDALKLNAANNGLSTEATSYTMEEGKKYVLTITINKTQIESLTASLVDWVGVDANNFDAANSYITITNSQMMDKKDIPCDNFDLYRLSDDVTDIYTEGTLPNNTNWFAGYNTDGKATLTEIMTDGSSPSGTGVWKTNWSWPSNKSFYHFRTVNKGTRITSGTGSSSNDYFEVVSGNLNDDKNTTTYNDYHWGAPMKTGSALKYDVYKGFEDYLYPAIGSTKSTINLIEHHMMSNVHVVLHTKVKEDNSLADNGVVLLGTKVYLTSFCAKGTVEMGRGVVNATDAVTASAEIGAPGTTVADYYQSAVGVSKKYSYRVVPQLLDRTANSTTQHIGLTIETADGNKYFVQALSAISAVTGTNTQQHTANDLIDRWYPGYDYTYHVTLSKTGIEAITCSIVDWVSVEGANKDITLED